VVSTVVPRHDVEGRVDSAAVKARQMARFSGASTWRRSEAPAWRRMRRTRRRNGHRLVCGGKITGLGFRGSSTLKKKNSSDGHDDVINTHRYIQIINACRYCGYACR
jgi:hypothetical protein